MNWKAFSAALLIVSAWSSISVHAGEQRSLPIHCTVEEHIARCDEDAFLALTERLAAYEVEVFPAPESAAQVLLTLDNSESSWASATFTARRPTLAVSPLVQRYPRQPLTVTAADAASLMDQVTGLLLYELHRCEDALPLLVTVEHAYYYEAICAIEAAQYAEAVVLLEDAPEENRSLQERTTLAWLYIQTGKPETAVTVMRDMPVAEDPALALPTLTNRARVYALTFDYTLATAEIDLAITLAEGAETPASTLAGLYTLRGEIVLLTYDWDAALADFNTALNLDPDYAPAYFQRGILHYTRAERELALADFQTYLELAPDGERADLSQQYIESIEAELEALG